MLKPTWRSEQKREEQAEAEAATAMAAEEPDFDTGQAYEEQGSDVADEDIDSARADDDSAIAEPESEPDSEHREAKRKRALMTTAAMKVRQKWCTSSGGGRAACAAAGVEAFARGIPEEVGASLGATLEASRRRIFHTDFCADADSPALARLSLRTI